MSIQNPVCMLPSEHISVSVSHISYTQYPYVTHGWLIGQHNLRGPSVLAVVSSIIIFIRELSVIGVPGMWRTLCEKEDE